MGTVGWSRTRPPPTAMKSLWHAAVISCPALNRAASRLSIMILRPLMPPAALHQSANAVACCTNSSSSPGMTVLAASLNSAMLMVFGLTPRTDEGPPGPGSHTLPTPGQTPLELDDDLAAAEAVDPSTIAAPATIMTAIASRSTHLRSWTSAFQNIRTLPKEVATGYSSKGAWSRQCPSEAAMLPEDVFEQHCYPRY